MAVQATPPGLTGFTQNNTQTVVVASSGTTSEEFIIGGRAVVNIALPALTSTTITYLVKVAPEATAVVLTDNLGSTVTHPVSTGSHNYMEPYLTGWYSVQLVMAAQGAARSIIISARGQYPSPFENAAASIVPAYPSAFPRIATYTKANLTAATAWTTGNSPQTLFTVTGNVLMQVYAVVTTGITSTGATGTLSVGVTGNTACLLPLTTMDGTNFPTGAVWTDTSPTLKAESLGDAYAAVLVANTNVIVTIATNSVTAGGIIVYCRWVPISAGAMVA